MNLEDEYKIHIQSRIDFSGWGRLAEYNWIEKQSWDIDFFAYSQMLDEHSREIANSINELHNYISRLDSWSSRLNDMDCEQEKIDLVIEFVTPIATLAINMPYVIRSRFIYSIAHLCHQANKAKGGEWKDDISPNDEIIFQTADKYGSKWRKYTAFEMHP
jgi:hypothetical protein